MTERMFDVLSLGNAIVDVISSTEDDFLIEERLPKGIMTLVDEPRAESLLAKMQRTTEASGGSAANTAAGVASLGGRAAFVGKVKDDRLGRAFRRDIQALGVHFDTKFNSAGPSTARCMVFVTPDGERTMATFLGACQDLRPSDVSKSLVEQSSMIYLEGYLWDPPLAKDAFRLAAKTAHSAGNRVALSLSDPFCVDRYRDEFLELLETQQIDLLFANQHELRSLFQTADLETALAAVREIGILAVVTRSEEGCSVIERDFRLDVPAFPVDRVIDATGAGDLFASGFLVGICRGANYLTCARLGALAASEVIGHFGARPETSLAERARREGLLS
jgi:sugar/nucleoside kinase (ribokinase family)